MIVPLAVSLLGAAAVLTLTLAVWSPVHAHELALRRRVEWFIDGIGRKPALVAVDQTAKLRRSRSRRIARGPILHAVEVQVTKAQVDITPERFSAIVLLLALIGFGVGFALDGPSQGGMGAAGAVVLAWLWLGRKAAGVQSRFAAQLTETVSLLASSVRAGQSVQQALEHVSQEAAEPTRSAFALVVREIGLGASIDDALTRLYERFPSEDMELMTTVISIQSAVGGSLAKILDTVGNTIRERQQMKAEVNALTSQQRYSAYVLALMPIALLAVFNIISPDYAGELFKPGLRIALYVAGGLIAAGFLVMRRLADIDV